MTAATHKVSILVPVYNEAYTVEQVLDEALAAPLPDGVAREIVAVDDGSTDGTGAALAACARAHPGLVTVLRHERNRGKGAAIRTALTAATGTICLTQDADLEYDPRDYARLVGPILEGVADAVYGSRFASASVRRVMLFWHSVGNRLLTLVSNVLTGLNLTDLETGYKAVRAPILKSLPIRCNRFGIEPELTAKLAKRGCRIYEVPVSYRGRSYREGKKITWRDGVKALGAMLVFRLMDDLYAGDYGKAILGSLSATHRFNRWMADQLRPWVGEEVLEIGAGLGNMTREFLPRTRYVVTDIDALYLDYLRSAFDRQRRVEVARVDVARAGDFAAYRGQFDTVICLNVVEHVPDAPAAIANLASALKPGGRACVLVPRGRGLYGTLDEGVAGKALFIQKDGSGVVVP